MSTFPPDVACSEAFVKVQRLAIDESAGQWAPTSTPIQASTRTPVPEAQSRCHPA